MTHPSIREAIVQWKAGNIAGRGLMRRLVSFDTWNCPVSESSAAEMLAAGAASRLSYSRDSEGVARLYLFSDSSAVDEFRRRAGAAANDAWHLLETRGTWFFQLPFDAIDFIVLDPGSESQLSYGREQFGQLATLARAVEIERTLAALRAGTAQAGAVQQVADYPHYLLPGVNRGSGYQLALAPDSRGRRLAAIFTAQDNFDAFCAEQGEQQAAGQLMQFELSGVQLFAQLQRMALDGLVFNCSGPAQPVAFAAALAGIVLQAAEGR